jgi:hypothetical protein
LPKIGLLRIEGQFIVCRLSIACEAHFSVTVAGIVTA